MQNHLTGPIYRIIKIYFTSTSINDLQKVHNSNRRDFCFNLNSMVQEIV